MALTKDNAAVAAAIWARHSKSCERKRQADDVEFYTDRSLDAMDRMMKLDAEIAEIDAFLAPLRLRGL